MLLLDALINFSKSYLPNTRGGSMDAPLVLSSRIDPEEIDDESHNLDIFERFPVEFYEKTYEPLKPAEVLEYIDNVEMHLGTPQQYEGLMFSHHTSSIHAGPTVCLYKRLPSMREKVEAQIALAENIRAVDQRGVVEKVLSSHFLPDIMGNSKGTSLEKIIDEVIVGPRSQQNINILRQYIYSNGLYDLADRITMSECPLR